MLLVGFAVLARFAGVNGGKKRYRVRGGKNKKKNIEAPLVKARPPTPPTPPPPRRLGGYDIVW